MLSKTPLSFHFDLNNFRIHSGDDFLGSLADVVFHCRDLGLGVEQVGVGIYGDHVAYGLLVCHFVNLCIFIQYRTDSTAAEFIAGLGGYTVHLLRKADLFKITSADCKSTVVGHAVNLAGDLMYSGMSTGIRGDCGLYRNAGIGTPLRPYSVLRDL